MRLKEIKSRDWSLKIDLEGGRIYELCKKGEKILGSYERIDGKTGNTHICVPNFAMEGVKSLGMVAHGPFRNGLWELETRNEKSDTRIKLETEGLGVEQRFSLGKTFSQQIIIKNFSSEAKRVNVAVHNYWDTPQGWQGIKLNGEEITMAVKSNPEIKIEEDNILEISGKNAIKWQLLGFNYVKVWTAFKEEGKIKIYDPGYVCIEPLMEKEGFVETQASFLPPGGEIIVEQRISG